MIPFIDPKTQKPLIAEGNALCDETGLVVAPIVDGIPRFVTSKDDYAENFGWQWHHWKDILSDSRATGTAKRELIDKRTQFSRFDLEGKTLLECGMGGGDDTEVLLQMPFSAVHAFDLSRSVDRARQYLKDPRLVISQASLLEIPYPDTSFDFVFCHRVLQHTPDPEAGLRSVARKVKPQGVLFAHCYRKHWRDLISYKYKYRWFTKRVPQTWIFRFVETFGARLRDIDEWAYNKNRYTCFLAENFVPWDCHPRYGTMNRE